MHENLMGFISFMFFWIILCNNHSNFFLYVKNILILYLLNASICFWMLFQI